jgi:hypothetical protein
MHSNVKSKPLRQVGLSVALLGGALAGLTTHPSAAGASSTVTKKQFFTEVCSLGILGSASLADSYMSSTYPTSVKRGTKFTVSYSSYINVTAANANKAYAVGARSFDGVVTPANVKNADASPGLVNTASPPVVLPRTPIHDNKPFHVPIPPHGVLTIRLKAGTPGKAVSTLQNAGATLHLYNQLGVAFATIKASCQPPTPPLVMASTKIT